MQGGQWYTLRVILAGIAVSIGWWVYVQGMGFPQCLKPQRLYSSSWADAVAVGCSSAPRHQDRPVWRALCHDKWGKQGKPCLLYALPLHSRSCQRHFSLQVLPLPSYCATAPACHLSRACADALSSQVLVGEDYRKRMYMMDEGGNLYYDSGNREVGFFQVWPIAYCRHASAGVSPRSQCHWGAIKPLHTG